MVWLLCRVLFELVAALPQDVVASTGAIAIDGTSATALLVDAATGSVLAPPKLYNEQQGPEAVQTAKVGHKDHTILSHSVLSNEEATWLTTSHTLACKKGSQ